MARPVAIRSSWRNDAAYLLRLEEAIEKDTTQSPRWRRETWRLARRLAQKFLGAEQRRVRAKKVPAESQGAGLGT
jgi:hypothetical protein